MRRLRATNPGKAVEVWAEDEARLEWKPISRRVWWRKGCRPTSCGRTKYEWRYVYAFARPATGRTWATIRPRVQVAHRAEALEGFAAHADPDRNEVLIVVLDRAGWHRAKRLSVPANVRLHFLPACTPQLQPVEPFWPLVREAVANDTFGRLADLRRRIARRCRRLAADHATVSRTTEEGEAVTRYTLAAALALIAAPAFAGYEQPSYIDGGQSPDGRFVVTAAQVIDPKTGTKGGPPKPHPAHGPFKWQFTWKDTTTGETKTFDAKGVQGGQIYAHLFVPPGGETFALFNHITLWHADKSHGHGANVLASEKPGAVAEDKRTHDAVSRRVIVYRKDGTILKEFGMNDFLTAAEWDAVVAPFNRAHWLVEYAPLSYRNTPRSGYAFYRLSPDHTVLEFRVIAPRGAKDRSGRAVHIELTKGTILPAGWKMDDADKTPMRAFKGPDKLPDLSPATREGYAPSLDPLRSEGKPAGEK